MAKYTTTIHDYLRNELIEQGYNEFFQDNRFTEGKAFITQLIKDDETLVPIMLNLIFEHFFFTDAKLDDFFKKTFLYDFYFHEIRFQTIEMFKLSLLAFMNEHKTYIEYIWENFADIISSGGSSTDSGKDESISKTRSATATQPQDNVNIDLNDDFMDYADTNDIQNSSNTYTKGTTTTHRNPKISDIYLVKEIYSNLFEDMEKRLFMAIY